MEKGKNEQVCQAVKAFFKYEGIPLSSVAERLQSTPRAVSAQLAGRPFSRKTAEKYAEAFGFSEVFLMTGEGELVGGGEKAAPAGSDVSQLIRIIASQQETIAVLAKKVPGNEIPPHHCEGNH